MSWEKKKKKKEIRDCSLFLPISHHCFVYTPGTRGYGGFSLVAVLFLFICFSMKFFSSKLLSKERFLNSFRETYSSGTFTFFFFFSHCNSHSLYGSEVSEESQHLCSEQHSACSLASTVRIPNKKFCNWYQAVEYAWILYEKRIGTVIIHSRFQFML